MTKVRQINPAQISRLRGKRSRESVAHEMRKRGHATDAKALWRWEKGHNQPNSRVIPDLADVLGCSIGDLYGDADEEDSDLPTAAEAVFLEALRPLARLLAEARS